MNDDLIVKFVCDEVDRAVDTRTTLSRDAALMHLSLFRQAHDDVRPPMPQNSFDVQKLGIVTYQGYRLPVGSVYPTDLLDHAEIPWLLVDGADYDPVEYPELHAVLRDQFGVNRLPDLRGKVTVSKPKADSVPPDRWAFELIDRDDVWGRKMLQLIIDWFEENDGKADDFGEKFIVADARHALANWTPRTESGPEQADQAIFNIPSEERKIMEGDMTMYGTAFMEKDKVTGLWKRVDPTTVKPAEPEPFTPMDEARTCVPHGRRDCEECYDAAIDHEMYGPSPQLAVKAVLENWFGRWNLLPGNDDVNKIVKEVMKASGRDEMRSEMPKVGAVPYLPTHSHRLEDGCSPLCAFQQWQDHIHRHGDPYPTHKKTVNVKMGDNEFVCEYIGSDVYEMPTSQIHVQFAPKKTRSLAGFSEFAEAFCTGWNRHREWGGEDPIQSSEFTTILMDAFNNSAAERVKRMSDEEIAREIGKRYGSDLGS